MKNTEILKSDYLDIVFDGRNKNYGGYELRKNYSKRARNAMVGTLLFVGLLVAVPLFASVLGEKDKPKLLEAYVDIKMNNAQVQTPVKKTEPKLQKLKNSGTQLSRSTASFTEPKIVDNHQVKNPLQQPDDSKKQIAGMNNSIGDDDASDLVSPGGNGQGNGFGIDTADGGGFVAPKVVQWAADMPEFLKGDVNEWLGTHTQYPDAARSQGTEGRVIVSFVVTETGIIDNVEIARTSGNTTLDKEAMRVVSSMPRWKPGKNNGVAVNVAYSLPITFALD